MRRSDSDRNDPARTGADPAVERESTPSTIGDEVVTFFVRTWTREWDVTEDR